METSDDLIEAAIRKHDAAEAEAHGPARRAYVLNAVLNDWANGRYCATEMVRPTPPLPTSTVPNALSDLSEDIAYGDIRWT